METWSYFQVYLITLVFCVLVIVGIILSLQKGLKRFMDGFSQDPEVSKFFTRLVGTALFLAGVGSALRSAYQVDEKSNWLTLSWDSAGQIQNTLQSFFVALMIFSIVFLVLHQLSKKTDK